MVLLVLGFALVGVGYVGLLIPGLPSTVFFIGAVWAFKKSSPRFELWLLNNRLFGPTLREWEETRCISPRVKVISITSLLIFSGASLFVIHKVWVQLLVAGLALFGAWFIFSRPSKRDKFSSPAKTQTLV